jgi:hypothetical protein
LKPWLCTKACIFPVGTESKLITIPLLWVALKSYFEHGDDKNLMDFGFWNLTFQKNPACLCNTTSIWS